jgi:pimeloyl-ACP methyl ester carboxylesterase
MIRAVQIAGSTSGAAVLEVIDKGSGEGAPPLLFVHGAWHGAWCWDDHFLDFFADKGFRALALSLRGHGKSSTDKRLNRFSIADYVDDVRSVAEALPVPPVVIGHSMGGFVVQKYLESNAAPAGVLLASAPPKGVNKSLMRFTK